MCPIFATLLALAALVGLIYLVLVWNFGYWRKRGIKEARAYPFFGSFPSQFTQKRNVYYDLDEIYKKYKKTDNFVGVYSSRTPQLVVLTPEFSRKVYVDDFRCFHDNEFADFVDNKKDAIFGNNPFIARGEEWKERRAEITPGLTASRIAATYPVTLQVCKSFADFIRTQIKMAPKDGIEAKELCLRFTTEVVSDCVLGIEAKSFTDNPTPIMENIQKGFAQSTLFMFYTAIANLFPQIRKIYLARFFPEEVSKYFADLMQQAIQLRRQTGQTSRVDFLNYILQLQDKKNLNIMELTAHTITFLTDGFETTSLVLSHTLLCLARNPEAMEKLREEIGESKLSFEELSELPYLDACLNETMRLFAPLLMGRKLCTEPCEFTNKDGTTLKVLPGQVVIVPALSMSRDPDIYEDSESFKPERFLPENGGVKKYRDMGAFLGFGNGPRICLGMRFAMTQMKAALVEIVRQFDVKPNPKTRTDNEIDDVYFMALLKGGIWLDFSVRE